MSDHAAEAADPEPDRCSAKGCPAPAQWRLLWNNPRLHTPDRRKTWLACGEHRQSLADFLDRRSFLREVQPHEAAPVAGGGKSDGSAADR